MRSKFPENVRAIFACRSLRKKHQDLSFQRAQDLQFPAEKGEQNCDISRQKAYDLILPAESCDKIDNL